MMSDATPARNCPACGKPLAETDRFCAACGAPADAGAAPQPALEPARTAVPVTISVSLSDRMLALLARFGKMIALLGFVLPWVTVSCGSQTLTTITGLSLATGNVAVRNPATGAFVPQGQSPELLVLFCALAIALALGASFLRARRQASPAAIGLCGTAIILAFIEVYVRVPAEVRTVLSRGRSGRSGPGPDFDRQMEQVITAGPGSGFWLTVLALAVAIGLHIWLLRRPEPEQANAFD